MPLLRFSVVPKSISLRRHPSFSYSLRAADFIGKGKTKRDDGIFTAKSCPPPSLCVVLSPSLSLGILARFQSHAGVDGRGAEKMIRGSKLESLWRRPPMSFSLSLPPSLPFPHFPLLLLPDHGLSRTPQATHDDGEETSVCVLVSLFGLRMMDPLPVPLFS